jgi:hypothetical protein
LRHMAVGEADHLCAQTAAVDLGVVCVLVCAEVVASIELKPAAYVMISVGPSTDP